MTYKDYYKHLYKESSIPTYKSPSQFYAGGKNVYKLFRQAFPKLPEQVANDIYNQTSPGTNPDITNQINSGKDSKEVFANYFSGKYFNFIKDPATNLTPEQLLNVLNGTWKLEILTVNPSDFSEHTLSRFIKRNFGKDEDSSRIKRQQSAAKADGSNEAVTVIKHAGKYTLWEGFHRTMSILAIGDNGKSPKEWDKVRLKAWTVTIK